MEDRNNPVHGVHAKHPSIHNSTPQIHGGPIDHPPPSASKEGYSKMKDAMNGTSHVHNPGNPAMNRKMWISNHLQQSRTTSNTPQMPLGQGQNGDSPGSGNSVHNKNPGSPKNGAYVDHSSLPGNKRVRIQEQDFNVPPGDVSKKMKTRPSSQDDKTSEESRDSANSPTLSARGDGDEDDNGDAPAPPQAPPPSNSNKEVQAQQPQQPYHPPEAEYHRMEANGPPHPLQRRNSSSNSMTHNGPPPNHQPPQMMSHPPSHPDTNYVRGYADTKDVSHPHPNVPPPPASSHRAEQGNQHYGRHAPPPPPPPPDYYYGPQQHPQAPPPHHGHGHYGAPPPPPRRSPYPQNPHHYINRNITSKPEQDKAVNRTSSTSSESTATSHPPQTGIETPHHHDVLCGRGSNINTHPGNVTFRRLVNGHKVAYVNGSRRDKGSIARHIVAMVRQQDPPGRFLARDVSSNSSGGSQQGQGAGPGLWFEIDDKEALAKCSQALRENASAVRNSLAAAAAERRGRMEEQALVAAEEKQQQHQKPPGVVGASVTVPEIQTSTSSGSNVSECSTSTAEMTARFRMQQQQAQQQTAVGMHRNHTGPNVVPNCGSLSFGLSVNDKRHPSMDGAGIPPHLPSPPRKYSDDDAEMMEQEKQRSGPHGGWTNVPSSRDHWAGQQRPGMVPSYGHPPYGHLEEHHRGQAGLPPGRHPPPLHHHLHRQGQAQQQNLPHPPVLNNRREGGPDSPHRHRPRQQCGPTMNPNMDKIDGPTSHVTPTPSQHDLTAMSQEMSRTDDFLSESAREYRGHLESANQHLRGMCALLQARVSDLEEEVQRLSASSDPATMPIGSQQPSVENNAQPQSTNQPLPMLNLDHRAGPWSKDQQQLPSPLSQPPRNIDKKRDEDRQEMGFSGPNGRTPQQNSTPQQPQSKQGQEKQNQLKPRGSEDNCRLDVAASLLAAAQSLRGVSSPANSATQSNQLKQRPELVVDTA